MLLALQARTRIVQSSANRWVKALRAALAHPPALARKQDESDEPPLLALEGFHLVGAALGAVLAARALFLRAGEEEAALRMLGEAVSGMGDTVERGLRETEILALPGSLFNSLLATEAPQPVAALVPVPFAESECITGGPLPLVPVLAGLQDPGNVGTLLRAAEAFGATGALLLPGTATPWNPKCLRASAGSALRLPLLAMRDAAEVAALLRGSGIASYAAVASGGVAARELELHRPAALWLGNEGAGLGAAELAACDARITVPMPGVTESLNAAVAGSILLYEAAQQRMAGRGA